MQVGFIGFGEASFEISSGLHKEGLTGIKAYDIMQWNKSYGPLINKRASDAKVQLTEGLKEVVQDSTILFVAVPADKAIDVSSEILPHINEDFTIYVDVSASPPKVKQKIACNLKEKKVKFVDAAMLGPLPVYKHQVPIAASGTGTQEFIQKMSPLHMNISEVGKDAGDASAIKLIRSVFMKGIVGLYIETLQASETFGVSHEVLSSLKETMDSHSFMDTMNRLITGSAIHAKRRAVELGGSIEMLLDEDINADISIAARDRLIELSHLTEGKFHNTKPSTWNDVLNLYK